MTEMKLITDMNDRERQRFVQSFRDIIAASGAIIDALEEHDDQAILVPLLIVTGSLMQLNELPTIIAKAQMVDMADLDEPLQGDGTDGD